MLLFVCLIDGPLHDLGMLVLEVWCLWSLLAFLCLPFCFLAVAPPVVSFSCNVLSVGLRLSVFPGSTILYLTFGFGFMLSVVSICLGRFFFVEVGIWEGSLSLLLTENPFVFQLDRSSFPYTFSCWYSLSLGVGWTSGICRHTKRRCEVACLGEYRGMWCCHNLSPSSSGGMVWYPFPWDSLCVPEVR